MSEKKGRKVARTLNIEIIGILQVIRMAKQRGVIQPAQPRMEDLQQAGFRFSPKIIMLLIDDESTLMLTFGKCPGS